MSQFDAATFLDATTTEAAAKRPPLPVGDYTAIIGELAVRDGVSKKDPTKTYVAMDINLEIDVPGSIQEELGLTMPTLKVKDSAMLDLAADGKSLDWAPGKNGALRRYREALGMNISGQPFSPRQMGGRLVTVKITHREYPEGSGDLFENVAGVAAHG